MIEWKRKRKGIICKDPFLHSQPTKGQLEAMLATLPRAPSYLNSRLLGYVTIGDIVPSSHYLGNWSPRVSFLDPQSRYHNSPKPLKQQLTGLSCYILLGSRFESCN